MSKKSKLEDKSTTSKAVDDLVAYQNEILQINRSRDEVECNQAKDEHDYEERFVEEPIADQPNSVAQIDSEDIKKFVQDQIRASERKIFQRFDRLEQKMNKILELCIVQQSGEEEAVEEEHLVDWLEPEDAAKPDPMDIDQQMFPITDEVTFECFFDKLKDEVYRNSMIQRRWPLTRNISTKSLNVAVKEFLRLHFDLPVCIKYSVSGYGAHGVRKKKLDSISLTTFVSGCFNESMPGFYSYQDISKAIVQFWGRAPDVYSKLLERVNKREFDGN